MPQSCEKVFRDYAALSEEAKGKLKPDKYTSFGGDFNSLSSGGFDAMLEKAGGDVDTALTTWRKRNDADYADTVNMQSKERAELKMEGRAQTCSEWQAKLDAVK
ncbi:hypothetical protein [Neisseria shayeganii]|uniref:Uncharacterized protein n=1 Tax=Neisseria shayeganii TaxID=607712 RepID=A0A7D7S8T4_9NEIS|nr:hypothetical protein [Neisseria shayeganii]QMT41148.1 hypothetical protein H3L94_03700 [Neisseria shayeganii]